MLPTLTAANMPHSTAYYSQKSATIIGVALPTPEARLPEPRCWDYKVQTETPPFQNCPYPNRNFLKYHYAQIGAPVESLQSRFLLMFH